MKPVQSTTTQLLLATLFVSMIVFCRFWIDVPNFQPVMAIALFVGFLFANRWIAGGTIVAGMLISDLAIGFYDWRLALTVYIALVAPVLLGKLLGKYRQQHLKLATGVIGFAGLSAVSFYLCTNLCVWSCSQWYPQTLSGLGSCLLMGLPFLKWTLASNLVFSTGLFATAGVMSLANSEKLESSVAA